MNKIFHRYATSENKNGNPKAMQFDEFRDE